METLTFKRIHLFIDVIAPTHEDNETNGYLGKLQF